MKIVTPLLVLLLLAVGLDRGAEFAAERVAADQARDRLALQGPVDVEVAGFPFLTQLATGEFGEVRVDAGSVPLGRLTAERLSVIASDVVADYGDPTATRARRMRLEVHLGYDQINHIAPEGVRVGEAGRRTVRLTAPLAIPGREVTARSGVHVEDGAVLVRAQRIRVNGTPLADTGLDSRVQGRLDFSIPLDLLPAGVTVTDVRAGPDGVVVFGQVRDVSLARLGPVGG